VADRRAVSGGHVIGGMQVGSQAVSHSVGEESQMRENGIKRAVTNAYLQLFNHLAIIRTKDGNTYMRDLG